jgi:hypothetical protein
MTMCRMRLDSESISLSTHGIEARRPSAVGPKRLIRINRLWVPPTPQSKATRTTSIGLIEPRARSSARARYVGHRLAFGCSSSPHRRQLTPAAAASWVVRRPRMFCWGLGASFSCHHTWLLLLPTDLSNRIESNRIRHHSQDVWTLPKSVQSESCVWMLPWLREQTTRRPAGAVVRFALLPSSVSSSWQQEGRRPLFLWLLGLGLLWPPPHPNTHIQSKAVACLDQIMGRRSMPTHSIAHPTTSKSKSKRSSSTSTGTGECMLGCLSVWGCGLLLSVGPRLCIEAASGACMPYVTKAFGIV